MKKYVNEAKEVLSNEELLVSYNHEQDNMKQRYIYDFEMELKKVN